MTVITEQIKLQRDSLKEGGFAGILEHRLVKSPTIFGASANHDGSWPGMRNFVYLADARFMPKGETRLHNHHEVDVISVMVKGNLSHEGSLGQGGSLSANDVQVQRAGGEGFSHNEVNPDDDWNRMIQIWVLPELAGQPASYKVYRLNQGESTRVYGGSENAFPSKTHITVSLLQKGEQIKLDGESIAYLTQGSGLMNDMPMVDGDMMSGKNATFTALKSVQLIIVQ